MANRLRKKDSGGTIMKGATQDNESLRKLKNHLRVLFQFDSAELDFGIYRIMNYKRKEIENFIENDLIRAIEKEFEKYKVQNQKELLEKIEEKRKEIRKLEKELGEKILKNGEIEEKFKDKPFAKEYTELKKRIEEIDITENIQSQVFNDLYNFFSRYYEDGDFISKRRYSSKQHKYAIPYSGEEVKLYWANFDQYYIKTGEIFKDYEFKCKGWKFVFRTVLADVEAGNVKGNRRYFLLSSDNPVKISNKICLIKFEYRPLTEKDLKQYPVKTKEGKTKTTGITQDELNLILKDKILDSITSVESKAILNETEGEKTILEKHLYKYTRKITSDFFIHKNLREFLERELDYFIKTEVLDIESLDTEKERYFDRHITRAKVVKNIGKRIIEFLSQIEDFQKMLWEKKKFVLKTDYVITIDRIPEEFYPEILKNKEQLREWTELGFGKVKTKKDLNGKKFPVDTKYFSEEFKERLLEKLSEKGNLDDLIDGILIKSENWQALNLILEKYKEKVQCIYIDPPFNTGNDEFIYKDKYQHSSWLSMMYDRLNLAKRILSNKGTIYVHIDYNENMRLRLLLDEIFGKDNFLNEVIYSYRIQGIAQKFWARKHQTIFYYKKSDSYLFNNEKERVYYEKPFIDTKVEEKQFKLSSKERNQLKKFIDEGRILPDKYKDLLFNKYYSDVFVRDVWDCDYTKPFISGSKEYLKFTTQKSEGLLKRIISSASNMNDYILDFMLGSGTTIAVAHKLRRKWIGIEMGEHFSEFYYDIKGEKIGIMGRMKKVLYGDGIGISNEVDWQGGGFFKYHYLEQYEDTLHNIEFPNEEKGQKVLQLFDKDNEVNEYVMKYMLKFETEGSPSLLNLNSFENPFEYKLKIISSGKGEELVNVDLVETFNYLLGLKINGYRFLNKNSRKYVIVFGERDNRRTAIIWRPTKDIDLKKDKEIIDKVLNGFNPDEIFINGDSFVKGYKPIESEFKNLAGV